MTSARRERTRARPGFATVMVFGIIIVAAVAISMIQSSAFSQAAAGRESMARARAYWAARAGVEATLARLEYGTVEPVEGDAYSLLDDMVQVAEGELLGATYRIATTEDKKEVLGPMDAHARININRMTRDQFLRIEPFMTEDTADSILDWIDADDEPTPLGAETPYYMSLPNSYVARNGPLRSMLELEMIAGVDPRDVRGEDWNQNGLLDANENDGAASWPPDNGDGVLDMGWSGIMTASSVDGGLTNSGEIPLDLKTATPSDIVSRTQMTTAQAEAIQTYLDNNTSATMGDFISTSLSRLARTGGGGGGQQNQVEALTDEQLTLLIDECGIGDPSTEPEQPGKLNLNTCTAEVLRYLPEISDETADAIIADRAGHPEGYKSIMDLLAVPDISRRQLATIYSLLCVKSNVYVVNCRGRDTRTGLEVEMMVTLDRSKIPVVISEVRVR